MNFLYSQAMIKQEPDKYSFSHEWMSLSITNLTIAGASTVTATFTLGLSDHSVTSSNLVRQYKSCQYNIVSSKGITNNAFTRYGFWSREMLLFHQFELFGIYFMFWEINKRQKHIVRREETGILEDHPSWKKINLTCMDFCRSLQYKICIYSKVKIAQCLNLFKF